jgi:hypothetical protein
MAAAVAGGAAVPALELEAAAAPAGQRFGLGAGLSIASSRTAAVGALADAARWTRTALALGPQFRAGSAPLMVDLRAGPVAALLHVEGVGLLRPQSDISLQLGGAAAVRALWSWGTAAPWLGVQVLAFPGRDLLEVGGDAQRGQLPRVELQIGGGLSLGRFP